MRLGVWKTLLTKGKRGGRRKKISSHLEKGVGWGIEKKCGLLDGKTKNKTHHIHFTPLECEEFTDDD